MFTAWMIDWCSKATAHNWPSMVRRCNCPAPAFQRSHIHNFVGVHSRYSAAEFRFMCNSVRDPPWERYPFDKSMQLPKKKAINSLCAMANNVQELLECYAWSSFSATNEYARRCNFAWLPDMMMLRALLSSCATHL